MDRHEIEVLRGKIRRAHRWLGIAALGWGLSVLMLIAGWVLSMTVLVTSSRLFGAIFRLP